MCINFSFSLGKTSDVCYLTTITRGKYEKERRSCLEERQNQVYERYTYLHQYQ